MGWYVRRSAKLGPFRINFSKSGIGYSFGVRGARIGTGPRGPYVAGGRGGIYFRQSLKLKSSATGAAAHQSMPTVGPLYCAHCGEAIIRGNQFCIQCGAKLVAAAALPSSGAGVN